MGFAFEMRFIIKLCAQEVVFNISKQWRQRFEMKIAREGETTSEEEGEGE